MSAEANDGEWWKEDVGASRNVGGNGSVKRGRGWSEAEEEDNPWTRG